MFGQAKHNLLALELEIEVIRNLRFRLRCAASKLGCLCGADRRADRSRTDLPVCSTVQHYMSVAQDKTVLTLNYRVSLLSAFIGLTSVVLTAFTN
jgi:hypothetical protein